MPASDLRLAEVMAALSHATDLGMGQPLEFALQSTILALRLADRLNFTEAERRAVYYQSLLRYIGCNAETRLLASIFGDELVLRTEAAHADTLSPRFLTLAAGFIRRTHTGESPLRVLQAVAGGMAEMGRHSDEFFSGHCEVAHRLAERLGFEPAIVRAMSQVYARWDGKGIPALKGDAISPGMLVVSLAQDAAYVNRLGDSEAAVDLARRRRGTLYHPGHVDLFCGQARELLAGFEDEPAWDVVLALEPGPRRVLSEDEFDSACAAMADFADLKSFYLLGHSTGVARLAAQAGRSAGLPETDCRDLMRAGLLHDLGRVGVSTAIWDKPGALSGREWEKVRLHTYHTERILARPAGLARLGALAARHHERLDGSGYHRAESAAGLTPAARLLAAADVFQALTEDRPHRKALTPEAAADHLQREVRAGRLDGEAAAHVLVAAGQRRGPARRELVAGLSEREVEVLRLIARGLSTRETAGRLSVSPKTVDNHIQHIYAKVGVTTRAGAALFAMESGLLQEQSE